jgi:hypothetical protein
VQRGEDPMRVRESVVRYSRRSTDEA